MQAKSGIEEAGGSSSRSPITNVSYLHGKVMGFSSLAKKFYGVGDYAGTVFFSIIITSTVALQQLTTKLGFRCPCVNSKQMVNCTTEELGNAKCSATLNYAYGLSFMLAPAIGFFVFGVAANPKMWKSITGILKKVQQHRRSVEQVSWTLLGVFGKAMISPISWIAMAMIDGHYYACAVTQLPYDVGQPNSMYASCNKMAAAKTPIMSDEFHSNRNFSQIIGWILICGTLLLGLTMYGVSQCILPLTYYHAKYYKYYRMAEEAEFDQEMEMKAHHEAERNVRAFMDKRRAKALWDKIATVYSFHRDKKKLALYSYLHQWVLEEISQGTEDIPDVSDCEDELTHLMHFS